MIGYVTLGTNNFEKAVEYYDALFDSIKIGRVMEQEGYYIAWAPSMDAPAVSVIKPFDKEAATAGNGNMIALPMESTAKVDEFYAKAIALGGTCEGAPGFRSDDNMSGFYAGYFRDLDGNKLNAFCIVPKK